MDHLLTSVSFLVGTSLFAAMCGFVLFLSGLSRSPYTGLAITAFINAVASTIALINAGENPNWSALSDLPFLVKVALSLLLFLTWWLLFQKQAHLDYLEVKRHSEAIRKDRKS